MNRTNTRTIIMGEQYGLARRVCRKQCIVGVTGVPTPAYLAVVRSRA